MKTLRFPQHPFTRSATLAILFALFGWAATAQTISGKVFNECTGQPIAGAEVNISVNLPGQAGGSWTITTQVNGSWNFSFSGGDPNGPYIITVTGGAHAPGFYTYYRSEGSKKGLDFDLLPDVFDITINGEAVSSQNNPSNPHTVCQNAVNCVELVANGGVDEFEPNTDYCYKLYLYSTDASGNPGQLLAESDCQNFSRPDPVNPCDPGFDLNALLHQAGQLPPVIRMEVRQFCCSSGCIPGEGTLVNTEVVFIEVLEIGPAQACFVFLGGANGDIPITPGANCQNAVSTCQDSPKLNGDCSVGEIDEFWIEINEYDPNTCEFVRTVADGSSNPTPLNSINDIQGLSLDLYVRNHWAVSGVNPPWDYFVPGFPPITVQEVSYSGSPESPMRYDVTLFVKNDCGIISTSGWFTNTDASCYGGGGGDERSALSGKNGQRQESEVQAIPNPVTSNLEIRYFLEEPTSVSVSIYDMTGKVVVSDDTVYQEAGLNRQIIDASSFPKGMYYFVLQAGNYRTGQFVKQ